MDLAQLFKFGCNLGSSVKVAFGVDFARADPAMDKGCSHSLYTELFLCLGAHRMLELVRPPPVVLPPTLAEVKRQS